MHVCVVTHCQLNSWPCHCWRVMQLYERAQRSAHTELEADSTQHRAGCKIFLGFTSNLISSGTREVIKFLCKHKMVDVLVTTAGQNLFRVHACGEHIVFTVNKNPCRGGWCAGGVEEDLIKCMAPTYVGSFYLQGKALRMKGQNRIGNMLVPNNNYCAFEEFMMPILDEMLLEQEDQQVNWTPSRLISRLGERIDNEDSVYYWCAMLSLLPFLCNRNNHDICWGQHVGS